MAGRKPLNSAIFMKARTQIILRADHGDIESRSEIVRLIELIEAHKAEGSLNKLVLSALMNQMRSDERGAHAPLSNTPQLQYEAPSAPQASRVLTDIPPREIVASAPLVPGPAPAANVADERSGLAPLVAAPVQAEVAKEIDSRSQVVFGEDKSQALPTPEMIIESTLRTLEHHGGALEGDVAPRPKKKMGGNALRAMG
ncbi:hypothetical protein HX878_21015 [Pseudomonas veronii]|uniref:hypothetical protein n=1 Tax=Pseudomonas veronii TaxID=76761 RepID=UPI0015A017D9|nr:hypothetical protein [Pseudomonas veronii]NWD57213.1 hypothetical protein [Pseudomonas veronii]